MDLKPKSFDGNSLTPKLLESLPLSTKLEMIKFEYDSYFHLEINEKLILLNCLIEDKSILAEAQFFWSNISLFSHWDHPWNVSLSSSTYELLRNVVPVNEILPIIETFVKGNFDFIESKDYYIRVKPRNQNKFDLVGIIIIEIFPNFGLKLIICHNGGAIIYDTIHKVLNEIYKLDRQIYPLSELGTDPWIHFVYEDQSGYHPKDLPEGFCKSVFSFVQGVFRGDLNFFQNSGGRKDVIEVDAGNENGVGSCVDLEFIQRQFSDDDFKKSFGFDNLPIDLQILRSNIEENTHKYQQIFNLELENWDQILKHYLIVGPNDDIDKLFYNDLNLVWGIKVYEPFKKTLLSFGPLKLLHYMQKILLFAKGNLIENVEQFYEINKKAKYLLAPFNKVGNLLKPLSTIIYFESENANAIKPRICILGYVESAPFDPSIISKITKNFNFTKFFYRQNIFQMIYIEKNEKVLPLTKIVQKQISKLCRC